MRMSLLCERHTEAREEMQNSVLYVCRRLFANQIFAYHLSLSHRGCYSTIEQSFMDLFTHLLIPALEENILIMSFNCLQ